MTRLESEYYAHMGFDSEHTRQVLKHYLPMFAGLDPVLELGCGRGEFLGLLKAAGIEAVGVDSDEGMAEAASPQTRSPTCLPVSAGCLLPAAGSWRSPRTRPATRC